MRALAPRLLVVLVLCALSHLSGAAFAEEDEFVTDAPVDTIGFFESVKGNYKILRAGGTSPHESNALGTVEREPGQSVLTFGYCPPNGGCDPGYLFLEDAKTQVTRTDATNAKVFNIVSVENGKNTRYTWQDDGATVTFRNYQYKMPNGTIVTLEHVLQKLGTESFDE